MAYKVFSLQNRCAYTHDIRVRYIATLLFISYVIYCKNKPLLVTMWDVVDKVINFHGGSMKTQWVMNMYIIFTLQIQRKLKEQRVQGGETSFVLCTVYSFFLSFFLSFFFLSFSRSFWAWWKVDLCVYLCSMKCCHCQWPAWWQLKCLSDLLRWRCYFGQVWCTGFTPMNSSSVGEPLLVMLSCISSSTYTNTL